MSCLTKTHQSPWENCLKPPPGKTEQFCWTSQHFCAQITTFSIFLPIWWLPVTLKIWRMDTDAILMPVEKVSPASSFFDYFFRYLWATVNCSGEHLNSPPPECFKANFMFQPSIWGDMFLATSLLQNSKHVFFHNPITAPTTFVHIGIRTTWMQGSTLPQ